MIWSPLAGDALFAADKSAQAQRVVLELEKIAKEVGSRYYLRSLDGDVSLPIAFLNWKYKMYKVEILSDKIEQEAINRRRRLDQERKERIFNPKLRVMGVWIEWFWHYIIGRFKCIGWADSYQAPA